MEMLEPQEATSTRASCLPTGDDRPSQTVRDDSCADDEIIAITADEGSEIRVGTDTPISSPESTLESLNLMVPTRSTPKKTENSAFWEYRTREVDSSPARRSRHASSPATSPLKSPSIVEESGETPLSDLDTDAAMASFNDRLALISEDPQTSSDATSASVSTAADEEDVAMASTSADSDRMDTNTEEASTPPSTSVYQAVLEYRTLHPSGCNTYRRLQVSPVLESAPEPVSVFTFNNYVREHRKVEDVEAVRLQIVADGPTLSYSDALKGAVMYGHTAYVIYLLENHLEEALSPGVCCPLLLLSVRLDHTSVTEALCRYARNNKKTRNYINTRGCSAMECRRTALHVAAEMNSTTILQTLILYGANHKAKDDLRLTPLERLLVRTPSAHLTFNALRCAWELIRCLPVLQHKICSDWHRLLQLNPAWAKRAPREWHTLAPGPFTLMQQTRCAIRARLGSRGLPHHTNKLGLPSTLRNYLNMQS